MKSDRDPPEGATTEATHVPAEETYRRRRLPSDFLRLVVALLAGAIGFLLASVLDNISVGITIEVIDLFDGLPNSLVVTTILGIQLVAWILPVVVLGLLLWWQRYRRTTLVISAVLAAAALSWGVQSEFTARFTPPDLAVDPPSWVCDNVTAQDRVRADDAGAVADVVTEPGTTIGRVFGSHACVPGDGFPSMVYVAGLAAGLSTLAPWLSRRWRRAGWVTLLAFLAVRLIDGLLVPVDALLIIALGYAIGAGTLLVFGSPDRSPKSGDVAAALATYGFAVTNVERIHADHGGSILMRATTTQGRRMLVKVRTSEERAADVLFRLYRMLRLRGFGDERPFTSLHREVEHEAAMSLSASAAGVQTPRMLRVADVTPTAMLIAFEEIDAKTLAETDPDLITDDVLRATWTEVGELHAARIAHRHLSPSNILLTSDAEPWLIDFGFAELSAGDGDISGDVAQLLATLTLVVGAERTVATAIERLGSVAVGAAAPRL